MAAALAAAGHQVVEDAATQPDLTIFHYPVWAFPHFTMLTASPTRDRYLLLLGSIGPRGAPPG